MTDSVAAIGALLDTDCDERSTMLSEFYERWKEEPLVTLKWLTMQVRLLHHKSPDACMVYSVDYRVEWLRSPRHAAHMLFRCTQACNCTEQVFRLC